MAHKSKSTEMAALHKHPVLNRISTNCENLASASTSMDHETETYCNNIAILVDDLTNPSRDITSPSKANVEPRSVEVKDKVEDVNEMGCVKMDGMGHMACPVVEDNTVSATAPTAEIQARGRGKFDDTYPLPMDVDGYGFPENEIEARGHGKFDDTYPLPTDIDELPAKEIGARDKGKYLDTYALLPSEEVEEVEDIEHLRPAQGRKVIPMRDGEVMETGPRTQRVDKRPHMEVQRDVEEVESQPHVTPLARPHMGQRDVGDVETQPHITPLTRPHMEVQRDVEDVETQPRITPLTHPHMPLTPRHHIHPSEPQPQSTSQSPNNTTNYTLPVPEPAHMLNKRYDWDLCDHPAHEEKMLHVAVIKFSCVRCPMTPQGERCVWLHNQEKLDEESEKAEAKKGGKKGGKKGKDGKGKKEPEPEPEPEVEAEGHEEEHEELTEHEETQQIETPEEPKEVEKPQEPKEIDEPKEPEQTDDLDELLRQFPNPDKPTQSEKPEQTEDLDDLLRQFVESEETEEVEEIEKPKQTEDLDDLLRQFVEFDETEEVEKPEQTEDLDDLLRQFVESDETAKTSKSSLKDTTHVLPSNSSTLQLAPKPHNLTSHSLPTNPTAPPSPILPRGGFEAPHLTNTDWITDIPILNDDFCVIGNSLYSSHPNSTSYIFVIANSCVPCPPTVWAERCEYIRYIRPIEPKFTWIHGEALKDYHTIQHPPKPGPGKKPLPWVVAEMIFPNTQEGFRELGKGFEGLWNWTGEKFVDAGEAIGDWVKMDILWLADELGGHIGVPDWAPKLKGGKGVVKRGVGGGGQGLPWGAFRPGHKEGEGSVDVGKREEGFHAMEGNPICAHDDEECGKVIARSEAAVAFPYAAGTICAGGDEECGKVIARSEANVSRSICAAGDEECSKVIPRTICANGDEECGKVITRSEANVTTSRSICAAGDEECGKAIPRSICAHDDEECGKVITRSEANIASPHANGTVCAEGDEACGKVIPRSICAAGDEECGKVIPRTICVEGDEQCGKVITRSQATIASPHANGTICAGGDETCSKVIPRSICVAGDEECGKVIPRAQSTICAAGDEECSKVIPRSICAAGDEECGKVIPRTICVDGDEECGKVIPRAQSTICAAGDEECAKVIPRAQPSICAASNETCGKVIPRAQGSICAADDETCGKAIPRDTIYADGDTECSKVIPRDTICLDGDNECSKVIPRTTDTICAAGDEECSKVIPRTPSTICTANDETCGKVIPREIFYSDSHTPPWPQLPRHATTDDTLMDKTHFESGGAMPALSKAEFGGIALGIFALCILILALFGVGCWISKKMKAKKEWRVQDVEEIQLTSRETIYSLDDGEFHEVDLDGKV